MTALTLLAAETGLSPGVVDVTGWILAVGGILLAAVWLHYLYR